MLGPLAEAIQGKGRQMTSHECFASLHDYAAENGLDELAVAIEAICIDELSDAILDAAIRAVDLLVESLDVSRQVRDQARAFLNRLT